MNPVREHTNPHFLQSPSYAHGSGDLSNGMKVLMISTDRNLFKDGSGVRQRVVEYARLVDELHIVVFANKSLGLSARQVAENVWIYPTNSRSKWWYIVGAIRIGKKIVSKKEDWLVTAQDPFETGLAGWRVARTAGARLHLQVHTDLLSSYFTSSFLNRIRVRVARFLLPKADCVRVVSKSIADSIKKAGIKLNAKPQVLPIFVNVSAIRNRRADVDLHKLRRSFDTIILMVSRLEKEKNIPLALSVFQRVLKKYPNTGLVIVGEGSERDRLEAYVRDNNLLNNVMFEGGNGDTLSFFKTADIFLHTSNYEGYGLVLVEAVASDCQIITTDVGIASEYFKDTESAHICPVGDEECLANRLMKSIEHKETRNLFALKAQSALEEHLKEKTNEEYLAAYKRGWDGCVR